MWPIKNTGKWIRGDVYFYPTGEDEDVFFSEPGYIWDLETRGDLIPYLCPQGYLKKSCSRYYEEYNEE